MGCALGLLSYSPRKVRDLVSDVILLCCQLSLGHPRTTCFGANMHHPSCVSSFPYVQWCLVIYSLLCMYTHFVAGMHTRA